MGATFVVDFSDNGDRQEGALHVRRRITDDISIDLVPGVLRLPDPRDEFITGYHIATRLHLWDAVLGLRYDALDVKGRVDVRDRIGGGGTYTTTDPGGMEHSLSAAIAFESLSGLALSVMALVLASLVPIN